MHKPDRDTMSHVNEPKALKFIAGVEVKAGQYRVVLDNCMEIKS